MSNEGGTEKAKVEEIPAVLVPATTANRLKVQDQGGVSVVD